MGGRLQANTMTADWLLLPVMPDWSWPLSWAVVAAAVVVWLWPRQTLLNAPRTTQTHRATELSRSFSQPRGPAWPIGLMAACAAILAVWPHGGWSGYAALALQSPSLLTLTWAIVCLFQATGWTKPAHDHVRAPALAWILLCALGWLLTIDTLNLWPRRWDISFYAWGFTAGSLWLSASLVMALAWLRHGAWVWSSMAVLAGYVCLRWPSGNLWDAWLDPAVWIVAHTQVARHAWHWIKQGHRT